MSVHLAHEISKLNRLIMRQASLVEQTLKRAVDSLSRRDTREASSIIQDDMDIDRKEVEIEEECLKILALHQPVATDLRYVVACMKMNNDLERVADLAAGIARHVGTMREHADETLPVSLMPLLDRSGEMLRLVLDALTEINASTAGQVIAKDVEARRLADEMRLAILKALKEKPKKAEYYIAAHEIIGKLCRICNYSANIAEDVVYMATGEIIRHTRKVPVS